MLVLLAVLLLFLLLFYSRIPVYLFHLPLPLLPPSSLLLGCLLALLLALCLLPLLLLFCFHFFLLSLHHLTGFLSSLSLFYSSFFLISLICAPWRTSLVVSLYSINNLPLLLWMPVVPLLLLLLGTPVNLYCFHLECI